MFSLKDKVAVITGASQGIGLASVKRFVQAGAKVVMSCRSDKSQLAKDIGAVYIKADVSKEEDVENLMKKAAQTYGKIDIVVNNAGIIFAEKSIEEADSEEYKKGLEVNVMGTIYGMKYGQKYMNDGGAIVNTASLGGVIGFPGYGAYGASKAAIINVTKTASLELAHRKISVNCVCPATINTPMAYAEGCEAELALSKVIWPLGRMGEPEEVAALIHFLASDDCKYVTGQVINIDGGYTAGIGVLEVETILQNVNE